MTRSVFKKPTLKRGLMEDPPRIPPGPPPPPPPPPDPPPEDPPLGGAPVVVDDGTIVVPDDTSPVATPKPATPPTGGGADPRTGGAQEADAPPPDPVASNEAARVAAQQSQAVIGGGQSANVPGASGSMADLPAPADLSRQLVNMDPPVPETIQGWTPRFVTTASGNMQLTGVLPEKGVGYDSLKGGFTGMSESAAQKMFKGNQGYQQRSAYGQTLIWDAAVADATTEGVTNWDQVSNTLYADGNPNGWAPPVIARADRVIAGVQRGVALPLKSSDPTKSAAEVDEMNRAITDEIVSEENHYSAEDLITYATANGWTSEQANQVFINGGGETLATTGPANTPATAADVKKALAESGPNPDTQKKEKLYTNGAEIQAGYEAGLKERTDARDAARAAYEASESYVAVQELDRRIASTQADLARDSAALVAAQGLDDSDTSKPTKIAAAESQMREHAKAIKEYDKRKKEVEKESDEKKAADKAQREVDKYNDDVQTAIRDFRTGEIHRLTGVDPSLSAAGQAVQTARRTAKADALAAKLGGSANTVAGGPLGLISSIAGLPSTISGGATAVAGLPNAIEAAAKSPRRDGLMTSSSTATDAARDRVATAIDGRAEKRGGGEDGFVPEYEAPELAEDRLAALTPDETRAERSTDRQMETGTIAAHNAEAQLAVAEAASADTKAKDDERKRLQALDEERRQKTAYV